jgi:hypothetical protein
MASGCAGSASLASSALAASSSGVAGRLMIATPHGGDVGTA